MSINRARLDRFISETCQINRKKVRLLLAQKRVTVDGVIATDIALSIDKFSVISLDNKIIQQHQPLYVMLYKPIGVVCATKDSKHITVIDLLGELLSAEEKASLHIVGRLDLNTSGLVLLTNDSRWSEKLTSPKSKVAKHYLVTLQNPLTQEYIAAFSAGMYFAYENITTQPVALTIINQYQAEVILTEGRYHQIKRMFGRFNNPVAALHRTSIGKYVLDESLSLGESKLINVSI
ncbi:pseudouridine synthase [Colwellia sp. 1_MG-2023]|uniref:pseudouridine synthase n=1 Tax=unclassified Colwellia TaxID=196834 RepID=UPI001C08907A|nr:MULTISPECIES: pseudouridine synthase [unclassified Colwellia]MBU2926250.1 pseudouridine synthase [Colwellia sp. C2M11]MDO6652328.1 pseudouridine synthase [Colwellia sp. 3_MG-2023]MDO6666912.1 pseudouridine synthase [Colwellia sp. 2_MG-2023]MDO6691317.1 pseudouridine synthase [Colwellia sp. 1_MG-2023]